MKKKKKEVRVIIYTPYDGGYFMEEMCERCRSYCDENRLSIVAEINENEDGDNSGKEVVDVIKNLREIGVEVSGLVIPDLSCFSDDVSKCQEFCALLQEAGIKLYMAT